MFCAKCGVSMPKNANFCPSCGASAPKAAKAAKAAKAEPQPDVVYLDAEIVDDADSSTATSASAQKKTDKSAAKRKSKVAKHVDADSKASKQPKSSKTSKSPKPPKASKQKKPLSKGKKVAICLVIAFVVLGLIGIFGNPDYSSSSSGAGSKKSSTYAKADTYIEDQLGKGTLDGLDIDAQVEKVKNILRAAREKGLIGEEIFFDSEAKTFNFTYPNGTIGGIDLSPNQNANPGVNAFGFGEVEKAYAASSVTWIDDTVTRITEMQKPQLAEGVGSSSPKLLDIVSFESNRAPIHQAIATRWKTLGLNGTVNRTPTLDTFESIKNYDIVLISMHGTRLAGSPVLCFDDRISSAQDSSNRKELEEDKTVARVWKTDDECWHYYVFPSYFEKKFSADDLAGKFIFSESCVFIGSSTIENESFPTAILSRGAATVCGMRNSVLANYSVLFNENVIEHLLEGETAGDAFAAAASTYGANDAEKGFRSANNPDPIAYPKMFGDTSARIVKKAAKKDSADSKASSADAAGWKEAYKWFVERGDYLDTALFFIPDNARDDTNPIEVGFHDMDGNGVPEMLISNGCEYEADACSHVYTYVNGQVRYLGSAGSGIAGSPEPQFYYSSNTAYTGLFWAKSHMGMKTAWYYTLSGGKLAEFEVYEKNEDTGKETAKIPDSTLVNAAHAKKGVILQRSIPRIENMGWDVYFRESGF